MLFYLSKLWNCANFWFLSFSTAFGYGILITVDYNRGWLCGCVEKYFHQITVFLVALVVTSRSYFPSHSHHNMVFQMYVMASAWAWCSRSKTLCDIFFIQNNMAIKYKNPFSNPIFHVEKHSRCWVLSVNI